MPAEPISGSIGYLRGRTDVPSTGRTDVPTFAMIPVEMLADKRLKPSDIRVFGALAGSRRGALVSLGERRIGSASAQDRRTVRRSLERLVTLKYIKSEGRAGQRKRYQLLSSLFAAQAKAVAPVTKRKPVKPEDLGSGREWVLCTKCDKRRPSLLKVGWCRSCNWDVKVDRRIDAKLKTA